MNGFVMRRARKRHTCVGGPAASEHAHLFLAVDERPDPTVRASRRALVGYGAARA